MSRGTGLDIGLNFHSTDRHQVIAHIVSKLVVWQAYLLFMVHYTRLSDQRNESVLHLLNTARVIISLSNMRRYCGVLADLQPQTLTRSTMPPFSHYSTRRRRANYRDSRERDCIASHVCIPGSNLADPAWGFQVNILISPFSA